MKNFYKATTLFPIPLIEFGNDCSNLVNSNVISYTKNAEYRETTKKGIHLSVNQQVLFLPHFKEIKLIVYESLRFLFYEVLDYEENQKFKISNSWLLKASPNTESIIHNHAFSFFSGVFYLDVGESDTITFFKDIVPSFETVHFSFSKKNNPNVFSSDTCKLKVVNSRGFLFPSSLKHKVESNSNTNNRYSLAFNVMPTGDIINKPGMTLNYYENAETI